MGGIAARLDREAAWPIGFIYGGNASPIDQHQVLAIGYGDRGDGTASLTIWNNNDGAVSRNHGLNFRGDQLFANSSNSNLNDIKGIICEEYAFIRCRPPRCGASARKSEVLLCPKTTS